jgi:hypothetical protein
MKDYVTDSFRPAFPAGLLLGRKAAKARTDRGAGGSEAELRQNRRKDGKFVT